MSYSPAIARTLAELEQQREEQVAQAPGPRAPRDRNRLMLAVGPESAKFLNTLIRATGAKRVLEVGGAMGYSTIWQGEAVQHNGGRLTTLEAVPSKVETLKKRIAQAELTATIEVLEVRT